MMEMRQFVLGIDTGSGGCKVTCIDNDGNLVSEASVPYPSYYPHPYWVEQKPEEWVDAAVEGVRKTLAGFSEAEKKEIKAISFSGPHHIAVLLDDDNRVIRDAIMWMDQRSGEEARELGERYGDKIKLITGNYPTPTWTLCQLAWMRKHEPETYGRIRKMVFMKDYIRYRFSGELATDYIEAEGTLFFDVRKREWSEELCALIELDPAKLPRVQSPLDRCGTLLPEMAERLGLPAGIAIVNGTADTAAELYGCGAVDLGDGVVKLATAGNYALLSDRFPEKRTIISYEHAIDGIVYQNSATNFAAASFRWFKENFYKETEEKLPPGTIYRMIDEEIERVPPGSEGLIFQPYLNGERSPHWDPHLRASFFGCTTRHGRSHFARAVLEGVGFSIRDASLEMEGRSQKPMKIIGGGSKGGVWIQIMADILNRELEVPKVSDASFGTCLIAATSIGWYANLKEAVRHGQTVVRRVEPIERNIRIYDEMFAIYRDLHRQTKDLCHRLGRAVSGFSS